MIDGPISPIIREPRSPVAQFFIFLGLFLLIYIIGNILGVFVIMVLYGTDTMMDIANLNITPHNLNAVWLLQFIGVTAPLLIIPIIFAKRIAHNPDEYLKTNFHFPWLLMVIAFLTIILSMPFIELLANINAKMVLPQFLKGLEKWMRESENSAAKVEDSMLQMKTIWNMIFDLLFIGLLTAIVEEIMFRGCLQTILVKWTKNTHAAVWITAILFSAFHMEFFGFLPRLLLGGLFGYFAAWSGSVWPGIWGHFVFNGTSVVMAYLFQHKFISTNPDDQHIFTNGGYIISFIITLLLLFIYRYISNKRQLADLNGEELG